MNALTKVGSFFKKFKRKLEISEIIGSSLLESQRWILLSIELPVDSDKTTIALNQLKPYVAALRGAGIDWEIIEEAPKKDETGEKHALLKLQPVDAYLSPKEYLAQKERVSVITFEIFKNLYYLGDSEKAAKEFKYGTFVTVVNPPIITQFDDNTLKEISKKKKISKEEIIQLLETDKELQKELKAEGKMIVHPPRKQTAEDIIFLETQGNILRCQYPLIKRIELESENYDLAIAAFQMPAIIEVSNILYNNEKTFKNKHFEGHEHFNETIEKLLKIKIKSEYTYYVPEDIQIVTDKIKGASKDKWIRAELTIYAEPNKLSQIKTMLKPLAKKLNWVILSSKEKLITNSEKFSWRILEGIKQTDTLNKKMSASITIAPPKTYISPQELNQTKEKLGGVLNKTITTLFDPSKKLKIAEVYKLHHNAKENKYIMEDQLANLNILYELPKRIALEKKNEKLALAIFGRKVEIALKDILRQNKWGTDTKIAIKKLYGLDLSK